MLLEISPIVALASFTVLGSLILLIHYIREKEFEMEFYLVIVFLLIGLVNVFFGYKLGI